MSAFSTFSSPRVTNLSEMDTPNSSSSAPSTPESNFSDFSETLFERRCKFQICYPKFQNKLSSNFLISNQIFFSVSISQLSMFHLYLFFFQVYLHLQPSIKLEELN